MPPDDCIITSSGLSEDRLAAIISPPTEDDDGQADELRGLYALPAITDEERRHGR